MVDGLVFKLGICIVSSTFTCWKDYPFQDFRQANLLLIIFNCNEGPRNRAILQVLQGVCGQSVGTQPSLMKPSKAWKSHPSKQQTSTKSAKRFPWCCLTPGEWRFTPRRFLAQPDRPKDVVRQPALQNQNAPALRVMGSFTFGGTTLGPWRWENQARVNGKNQTRRRLCMPCHTISIYKSSWSHGWIEVF